MMEIKKERICSLDLIRVSALVLIIIYHFQTIAEAIEVPGMIKEHIGPIGVGLYLAISGVLLAYHYYDNIDLKKYLKKRILAVMLPFWIAYLIVLGYNFLTGTKNPDIPLYRMIYTIMGVDGFLSYKVQTFYLIGEWFLGCILLFYLAFPIIRILAKKIPILFACGVIMVFFIVSMNYVYAMPMLWNPWILLPNFVFGVYFAAFIKKVSIDMFIAAIISYGFTITQGFGQAMVNVTIEIISLFIIIYFLGQKIKNKTWKNIIFKASKYSYGVILFHHVVIQELGKRYRYCSFQQGCRDFRFPGTSSAGS